MPNLNLMKLKNILLGIIMATFIVMFSSCEDDVCDVCGLETVEVIGINTKFGNIFIQLFKETPIHYRNFDSLINANFYDSTEFHRCVDDFVIQGGSPTSKDNNRNNDGSGGPGYTLPAEIDTTIHKHKYGSLAAARLGNMTNPERRSSGSQFYIVTDPDGASFLDGEYTVFGKVLSGMDVAKIIESQSKNSSGLPDQRIKMFIRSLSLSRNEATQLGIVL